ncbi:MAG TPA: hypothetical protein VFY03_07035 [Woeseiaceae bacterium]|nr:hypothetical protein [Woeseiaceae bacterium]
MTGGTISWRQLREFAGIEVDRSFVLGWSYDRETLVVDADVELRPEHPFYEPPRRRETACMRAASIEFPYCTGLRLNGRAAGDALPSMVAGLGAGAIHDLVRKDEGAYVLTGEFGAVEIEAERPLLRLQGA